MKNFFGAAALAAVVVGGLLYGLWVSISLNIEYRDAEGVCVAQEDIRGQRYECNTLPGPYIYLRGKPAIHASVDE